MDADIHKLFSYFVLQPRNSELHLGFNLETGTGRGGEGSPHRVLRLWRFHNPVLLESCAVQSGICTRCWVPGTLIRADVAAGTESRHGNCVPNLSIPLSLHSLKMLFLSTFTVGAKPETRVQSAAAASTKSYEIRSKIACLPHRHAKQPASQGGRVTQQLFPSISRGSQWPGALRGQGGSVLVKNTQRGAEPVDRAPGELRASILAPVEAVHSFPKPANLLSLAPVGDIYLS